MLVDFHSHLASENSIVCTDTPDVMTTGPALLRSIGLLPDKWSQNLEDKLLGALSDDENLQLGEVGLDRRFTNIMPVNSQADALKRELGFAISLGRSISLHCVRETGLMVSLLSEFRFRPFCILWHGFTGSAETAAELYRLGVVISIGPRFSCDVKSLFSSNRMAVLETDYLGESLDEHQMILSDHYSNTARALGMSMHDLELHCTEVLKTFCPKAITAVH